jgi:ribosomal protein S18 acetylase RimI-like enzyme
LDTHVSSLFNAMWVTCECWAGHKRRDSTCQKAVAPASTCKETPRIMPNAHEHPSIPPGFITRDLTAFPSKDQSAIAKKVAKLEKKVFPAIEHFSYEVELKKKNIGVMVAFKEDDADTLVAYLVYQRMKRLAWLHKLCVTEQEREKGLAKALIHSLRHHMERGGCHTITLWVDENRQPARALYKSCGFEQTECRPDYYGPGRTALKLELSIGE